MNALAIIMFMVVPWLVGAALGFAVMDVVTDLARAGLSRMHRTLALPQADAGSAHQSHR